MLAPRSTHALQDYRAFHNETPGVEGTIAIGIDPASQMTIITGQGFYSLPQVTRYAEHHTRLVRTQRVRGHPVRALVDLRFTPVQLPEVAAFLEDHSVALYVEGDRIALVVGTALAKMQVKRVVAACEPTFFDSIPAAEAWLFRPA